VHLDIVVAQDLSADDGILREVFRNAAADWGSPKSTTTGANGVPASYSAISTFWQ